MHACHSREIAVAAVTPDTATGTDEPALVPLPSCPD